MNKHSLITVSTLALVVAAGAFALSFAGRKAQAHCQVPCGIYDDTARIRRLREDATTIAKAIDHINKLAGSHDANAFNQASRWVTTKEQHASNVITVVAEYFLTQKVKVKAPGADGYDAYLKSLADHHAVMTAAMKTKQSADPATVTTLNGAIDALARHYK